MGFPNTFLDDLTSRTDIVDVISRYVALKRRGGSMVGLCPFHAEKTPSFTVSPDKQVYHCFGCGAGGGAIQFIIQAENLDFQDAVKLLAERAGMDIPEQNENAADKKLRERLYELHTQAARFYYQTLISGGNQRALEYLNKRGVSPKTVRGFGLGATPQGSAGLVEAMTEIGFTKSELLAGKLAAEGEKGGVYDRFRNRLMFPILDVRKKVIAFGGRILSDGQPKYLNSSESPIFFKSRQLFALNFAKASKRDGLLLAEGYMDVVSLHQAGFDNAVASLGTSLTELQAQLIRKYANEVTIAYDSDNAGRAATERATAILTKAGLKVSVLSLGEAKDPDEFIQKFGAAALSLRMEERENHMSYSIGQLAAAYDLQSDEGRVSFLKDASARLAAMGSEIEREVYTSRVAQMAGVGKEAVAIEVKKRRDSAFRSYKRKEERKTVKPPPSGRAANLKAARAEEEFIRLVLDDITAGDGVELTPEDFSTPLLGRVWELILSERSVSIDVLSQYLAPDETAYLARLRQGAASRANAGQALEDCVETISKESAARAASMNGENIILARALQNIEKKRNG